MGVWIDGNHASDDGSSDEHNIDGSQYIILETELDRREDDIEKEIEDERQRYDECYLPSPRHPEHLAEGDDDQDIQYTPYRSEQP